MTNLDRTKMDEDIDDGYVLGEKVDIIRRPMLDVDVYTSGEGGNKRVRVGNIAISGSTWDWEIVSKDDKIPNIDALMKEAKKLARDYY